MEPCLIKLSPYNVWIRTLSASIYWANVLIQAREYHTTHLFHSQQTAQALGSSFKSNIRTHTRCRPGTHKSLQTPRENLYHARNLLLFIRVRNWIEIYYGYRCVRVCVWWTQLPRPETAGRLWHLSFCQRFRHKQQGSTRRNCRRCVLAKKVETVTSFSHIGDMWGRENSFSQLQDFAQSRE